MVTMGENRKLLMVSALFSPTSGPGSVRSRKFARYLGEFGWEPTVLTVREPAGPGKGGTSPFRLVEARFPDPASRVKRMLNQDTVRETGGWLTEGIAPEAGTRPGPLARVIVAGIRFAKQWIAFPDHMITWIPFAVSAGLRELRSKRYDAIYSTSPPATNHIVACILKRITGLPWVADYRDLWSLDTFQDRTTGRRKAESYLERLVMKDADRLVTVTEPFVDLLWRFHRRETSEVAYIPNGYDLEDNTGETPVIGDRLVFTYTGYMYGLMRSPRVLLEVLDRMIEAGDIEEGEVLVRFYCDREPRLEELASNLKHPDIMEVNPLVSRDEALLRQRESTALLHLMLDDPNDSMGCGSKVFEYFAAGRPILVWAPHGGVIGDLVSETGTGEMATSEAEMEEILRRWIAEFQKSGVLPYSPVEGEVKRYDRRELTGELAGILDQVAG